MFQVPIQPNGIENVERFKCCMDAGSMLLYLQSTWPWRFRCRKSLLSSAEQYRLERTTRRQTLFGRNILTYFVSSTIT